MLAPSDPAYVIANADLLDITISELSGADTACTGFSDEKGCREFKLSWINELQGDNAASLELNGTASNKAVSADSLDSSDTNITTDPKDYYLIASNLAGTSSNINGTAITIEDTDGIDGTKSMTVSIKLK